MKSISIHRAFRVAQVLMVFILAFLVFEGMTLWRVCREGTRAMQGLESEGLPSSRAVETLQQNLVRYRLASYELMFVPEEARAAKSGEAEEFQKRIEASIEKLKAVFPAGEGATLVGNLEKNLAAYRQSMRQIRTQLDTDFQAAMQMLDKDVPGKVKSLEKASDDLKGHCDRFVGERTRWSVDAFHRIQNSSTTWGSMGVAFSVVATALVTVNSRRIRRALLTVVNQLSQSSDQVEQSTAFVASAGQSLAAGASEQAASLEETSSSLEEMSSRTRGNTENADKAKQLARETRQAADTSTTDMEAMQAAMEAIKVSSDDVGKIIKTIDEIAFQTNILALNAAVEAARAGEAGMGFAVVADEVRSLAQRCAQSARETASKIEGAVARAGQGVEISSKVTHGLQGIVTKVRQVDQLVADVATASREQSEGIGQITQAVGQMDLVVQKTAAHAEETASASQELSGQAHALKSAVSELLLLVGGVDRGISSSEKPLSHPTALPERRPAMAKKPVRHAVGAALPGFKDF